MKRAASFIFLSAALSASALVPAGATDKQVRDQTFFRKVSGTWTGPGEIVAGKYKGTKFVCNFVGSTPSSNLGMTLDGGCRVGMFTQKMTATVEHKGKGRYGGTFLDGAAGEGLDIVSGNVVDEQKAVMAINRKELRGAMIARLTEEDGMVVTVSVRVDKKLVPVIGMNLKRIDGGAVGSIAGN